MRRVAISGPLPGDGAVGGVAVHTDRLAAALAATGREVLVLDDSHPYSGMPEAGASSSVVGVRGASLNDVMEVAWHHGGLSRAAKLRAIPSHERRALGVPVATAVVRGMLVGAATAAYGAEVLHIQQADFRPLYADWGGVRLPRVITVHGLGGLATGEYPALRTILPANLKAADAIVTPSRALAAEVAALGIAAERVSVIPNGVDQDLFRPRDRVACRRKLGIDPHAPLVVYSGRITRHKGVADLLTAWPLVSAHVPKATLALVGPPDQELTTSAPGVHRAGAVSHETTALWLGAADVVAVPSRYEGFGLAALEAMASGRAVVATRVGGLPEIVGTEAGLLVPVQDPEALADALARLLGDRKAATVAGAAGARLASAYTWENAARAYGSLYDAL